MIKVGLLTAWLAFLPSAHAALSPTNPSIAEARRTLNHLLEQSDADPRDLIALLRSYRGRSTAPALTIASGPYFGFILSSQINELYPLAYDAEWNKDVAHPDTEVVAQVSPVTIFDALMDLCLDGKAPPQFAPRCKQIGRPLMERIREAKEDQLCQLDASNQTDPKASGFGAKIKLLFMKIATWVGSEWPSSCDARKAVYAYAKHDILEARRTDRNVRDEILKEFPNLFPERFREGFLEQMAELRKALPALITAKFSDSKTKPDPLWSAPLVELEDERDHVTSVREVAEGLKADFGMAALLAHSKDMAERALAAPLFYAASNRLILVLGGLEARWNRGFERFDVLDRYDPAHYKAAPKFVTELFGGIGAELDHAGAAIFSPWDFSSYPFGGGKFRVFPSRFTLDLRHSLGGVPHPLAGEIPSESFADLAELLSAAVEYLKATRPGAPMSEFFGDARTMSDILDPTKPVLFPKEGRELAFGIVGSILRNVTTVHIEKKSTGAQACLGVVFHDQVNARGEALAPASVRGVSELLRAGEELRQELPADPQAPQKLLEQLPLLRLSVAAGTFELSCTSAQAADGGFSEAFSQPMSSGRTLQTAVSALRAMTRSYTAADLNQFRLMAGSIKQGWLFLDRFFDPSGAIFSIESGVGEGHGAADSSTLWEFVLLWQETQGTLRTTIEDIDRLSDTKVDWARWESRMTRLRQQLLEELRRMRNAG